MKLGTRFRSTLIVLMVWSGERVTQTTLTTLMFYWWDSRPLPFKCSIRPRDKKAEDLIKELQSDMWCRAWLSDIFVYLCLQNAPLRNIITSRPILRYILCWSFVCQNSKWVGALLRLLLFPCRLQAKPPCSLRSFNWAFRSLHDTFWERTTVEKLSTNNT